MPAWRREANYGRVEVKLKNAAAMPERHDAEKLTQSWNEGAQAGISSWQLVGEWRGREAVDFKLSRA